MGGTKTAEPTGARAAPASRRTVASAGATRDTSPQSGILTRGGSSDRAAIAILGILAAAYIAVFAYYFPLSIVSTPFGDMLEWIREYYTTNQGLFAYLWQPHNEHRLVFPKLLVIGDAVVFHGAVYPVVVLSLLLVVSTAWAIVRRFLAETWRRSGGRLFSIWVVSALALLFFPTTSLVDYVYPKNVQVVLVCFFAFWAIASMAKSAEVSPRKRWVYVSLAVVLAACASASAFNGLLVWFALAWVAWRSRAGSAVGAGLGVAGTAMIVAYLIGHQRGPVMPTSVDGVVDILRYFVEFLGIPWVKAPGLYWVGCAIGAAIALLSVRAAVRVSFAGKPPSPATQVGAAMLGFCVLTALMTAMGRFRLGLLPAHRYGLYGLAAYASLFMLALPTIAALWKKPRARSVLLWGSCLLGTALLAQQVVVGRFAAERAEYFSQLETRILNGERDPAVTHDIFPDQHLLEEQYRVMREQKIYMFSAD